MRPKKPSGRFSMILKIWREFLSGLNLWFSSEPKVGKTAPVAELVILMLPLFYPLVTILPLVVFAVSGVMNAITFFAHGLFIPTNEELLERKGFILYFLAEMGINISFVDFMVFSLMLSFLLSVYSQLMRGIFIKNIVYNLAVPAFCAALYHAQFGSSSHFVDYVINNLQDKYSRGAFLSFVSMVWICLRFGYFDKFVTCFFEQEACQLAVFRDKRMADTGYISGIAAYLVLEYFFFFHGV